MKLLVDAHALIWSVDQPGALSVTARDALADAANALLVSIGTIWEISIKSGLGRLTLSQPFRPWIERAIRDLGASVVPLSIAAADGQAQLPHHHRDPFDRMLVAQSQIESASIVSRDGAFDTYGIQQIW